MVTTLKLSSVATFAAKRVLPAANWRPESYMEALIDSGFTDVRMEDKLFKHIVFQAIYATALKWDKNKIANKILCRVFLPQFCDWEILYNSTEHEEIITVYKCHIYRWK